MCQRPSSSHGDHSAFPEQGGHVSMNTAPPLLGLSLAQYSTKVELISMTLFASDHNIHCPRCWRCPDIDWPSRHACFFESSNLTQLAQILVNPRLHRLARAVSTSRIQQDVTMKIVGMYSAEQIRALKQENSRLQQQNSGLEAELQRYRQKYGQIDGTRSISTFSEDPSPAGTSFSKEAKRDANGRLLMLPQVARAS